MAWWVEQHPVCLVTGLFCCEDVQIAESEAQEKLWEVSMGAPLGDIAATVAAANGVPMASDGTGNAEGKIDGQSRRMKFFKAEGGRTYIFAIQLKVITTDFFDKANVHMTDESPRGHWQLGPESVLLPSVEDIQLVDLDLAAWVSLEEQVGDGGEDKHGGKHVGTAGTQPEAGGKQPKAGNSSISGDDVRGDLQVDTRGDAKPDEEPGAKSIATPQN
ncbi:hypothetical protein B0H63DRAFT_83759 [Podospora didyma]|uniref:Uncharacterized protein n=1 Tax=Podospora didyma TaxID=330526 RepID=A0AAE0K046_9PEZI|nr:hypothetical protein B0H63DRAFT_83759 [Podospora didyma]